MTLLYGKRVNVWWTRTYCIWQICLCFWTVHCYNVAILYPDQAHEEQTLCKKFTFLQHNPANLKLSQHYFYCTVTCAVALGRFLNRHYLQSDDKQQQYCDIQVVSVSRTCDVTWWRRWHRQAPREWFSARGRSGDAPLSHGWAEISAAGPLLSQTGDALQCVAV